MGAFYTRCKVENIVDREKSAVVSRLLVDTGSEYTWIPSPTLERLGIEPEKKDLAFLDILATNNWERPIYLNNTSRSQLNLDMNEYLVQEGNAYRVLPMKNNRKDRDNLVALSAPCPILP